MKTLYIECNMGAAGDMLMSALSELIPNPDEFIDEMNGLGLPDVRFERKSNVKCGVVGTHIAVTVDGYEENEEHDRHERRSRRHQLHEYHEHHGHRHAGLEDIRSVIEGMKLSENVREQAIAVYTRIAQAESEVHGMDVDKIHFHELGNLDAIADVLGVCRLMEMIAPERVVVSPIHVGRGYVRCAHGVVPVPAPATALILQGAPIFSGCVQGELCTPTGAALLRHFADEFGDLPPMTLEKIGYGMGNKDFEIANCIRAMLGNSGEDGRDEVSEICCNLDDMTGEDLAWAAEILRREGALDVYTIPIQMKKGRPGVMLCCICSTEDEEKFATLMLKHTTTIGVRCRRCSRYVLDREIHIEETEEGPVRVKRSFGYGIEKCKIEADDRLK